jgi:hypothetical protein
MIARPAWWAFTMAAVVAVALVVSGLTFAVAYAVAGWSAIDDTWVGLIVVVSLLGGLVTSLVAFVLALVVKKKHRWWEAALASLDSVSRDPGVPGGGRIVLAGVAPG